MVAFYVSLLLIAKSGAYLQKKKVHTIKKWNKSFEAKFGTLTWTFMLEPPYCLVFGEEQQQTFLTRQLEVSPLCWLWTSCCWRVSEAGGLPGVKRADWWQEAGWARWAFQEISISRQRRGIIAESKNQKRLTLLFQKQEVEGAVSSRLTHSGLKHFAVMFRKVVGL